MALTVKPLSPLPTPKRSPSPLPSTSKTDLWKEAYENIRKDPDDSAIYAKFREIINAERGRGSDARLSTEHGRKDLLDLINDRQASLESRQTSPKMQQALSIAGKARNVIALGAAANPFSTVAVAGLFIVFDMKQMYDNASQAMLNVAIDIADIICRCAIESREAHSVDSSEPQELVDLRDRLRGCYVQLYRTILLLTMKLVRTLNSKVKIILSGWSDWDSAQETLERMERRVTKILQSITNWYINRPGKDPNWGIKGRNELHNAARYGQTSEVYRLINSGKSGPAVINARTVRGWTPLMFAVENGHYDIMDMLLETRSLDVNIINDSGHTALYMATVKNRTAMMRRLLLYRARVDVRDTRGRTEWLMIAMSGYLEALKLLRANGAQLNQVTTVNGYSALHSAVEGNQLETVKWLLKEGIDKNIKITNGNFAGMSARDMARSLGREDILRVLS